MATFDFFTDTALTTPLPAPVQLSHNSDFSDNPQDLQVFFGSLGSSLKVEANSNPGTDNIIIDVVDSDPGNNHEDTEIKLATTQGGLAAATPGASLTVATSVLSGAANDFEFWVRVTNAVSAVDTITELSFTTNALKESAQ
jgi:hypothetical protein